MGTRHSIGCWLREFRRTAWPLIACTVSAAPSLRKAFWASDVPRACSPLRCPQRIERRFRHTGHALGELHDKWQRARTAAAARTGQADASLAWHACQGHILTEGFLCVSLTSFASLPSPLPASLLPRWRTL